MSAKYTVTATWNEEGKEVVLKTKDLGDAIRRFLEEAEEPYWSGDRTEVTLTFVAKGPKHQKI